ncbi:MAG: 5-methyltetrahydropteroyltriglutamate--homocysteine S-methyltransferase [Bifidobacteriaceae bacterium]|nr:5-methyltetrahydropteroyltriglutamate--homocysteine S-methyltransferase [Bifidobacteriaceae bacterium]
MTSHSTTATVLGYPRQGPRRELKSAVEAYWSGRVGAAELEDVARRLRGARLAELRAAGLGEAPSNDFSYYDHVLDTAWLLGAIPPRFGRLADSVQSDRALDPYFALARGGEGTQPLELTKWFDTNYHYLVPEITPDMTFTLNPAKVLAEFDDARNAGVITRPVLLGPVSFLLLAKAAGAAPHFSPLDALDRVLPLYQELLALLADRGAEWVQLDEPCLVLDQDAATLARTAEAYATLAVPSALRPSILLATYFGRLGEALPVLADAPVEGLAIDFTGSGRGNFEDLRRIGGLGAKRLVAGLIDGRNVWTADLAAALRAAESLVPLAGALDIAASCSLLHVPLDVTLEDTLPAALTGWLAFARQKLAEIVTVARGVAEGPEGIVQELEMNRAVLARRASSPLRRVSAVRRRAGALGPEDRRRGAPRAERAVAQRAALALPTLPTTTIGSFPQTAEVRAARAAHRRGELTAAAYEQEMRAQIAMVVDAQERLGLDLLVHGEPERNDMVQYFAEQLDGFWATAHGWVQSYGSRYVRPPILFGDVSRPAPITVPWTRHAMGLTNRPVKGMLTGPVTMLAWSFVREDQPLAATADQVALALRDEVADLEAAGARAIQVDEPALRELLPLRRAERAAYLDWAVGSFLLATGGAAAVTQVHTHMCYADFGDVIAAIEAMDPDVVSLEAARSGVSLLTDLASSGLGKPGSAAVGPGVWDIHSPRVPGAEEVAARIRAALAALGPDVWVNPDCGLKTRAWPEVEAALANLVAAARQVRAELAAA